MLKGGTSSVPSWAGLGALGRCKERDLMQDATTSESEREMALILMSWRGSNGLGWEWEVGVGGGVRSQQQKLGRWDDCCLLAPGDKQCVQPLWGLVWAVTQASQVEGRLLSCMCSGCRTWSAGALSAGCFFFSSRTVFLTLIGSLGPWE